MGAIFQYVVKLGPLRQGSAMTSLALLATKLDQLHEFANLFGDAKDFLNKDTRLRPYRNLYIFIADKDFHSEFSCRVSSTTHLNIK